MTVGNVKYLFFYISENETFALKVFRGQSGRKYIIETSRNIFSHGRALHLQAFPTLKQFPEYLVLVKTSGKWEIIGRH